MQEKQIPLYKNHIFLLVIILPLLSVVGSFTLLYIALKHNESPVLEGYYKDGLSPQKMKISAQSKQITATINNGILTLKSAETSEKPLKLKLEHPTLAERDQYIELKAIAPNTYALDTETKRQLKIQRWYLRLYDQDKHWEIKGEAHGAINGTDNPIHLKA